MDKNDDLRDYCKSVFKDGSEETTKEVYTSQWIKLINLLERNCK